jgi:hypothetical protein
MCRERGEKYSENSGKFISGTSQLVGQSTSCLRKGRESIHGWNRGNIYSSLIKPPSTNFTTCLLCWWGCCRMAQAQAPPVCGMMLTVMFCHVIIVAHAVTGRWRKGQPKKYTKCPGPMLTSELSMKRKKNTNSKVMVTLSFNYVAAFRLCSQYYANVCFQLLQTPQRSLHSRHHRDLQFLQ